MKIWAMCTYISSLSGMVTILLVYVIISILIISTSVSFERIALNATIPMSLDHHFYGEEASQRLELTDDGNIRKNAFKKEEEREGQK